jgi:ribosome biogenesis SPOUT family RNA methylase Rps3
MNKPLFIIEHLEPELWKWCLFEYEQSSKTVGQKNILFTNIKRNSVVLRKLGKCESKSVFELGLPDVGVCILDPLAKELLTPQEAKKFDYFVIGGILGEEKLNGRTERELTTKMINAQVRNIGFKQFTIDNAVYVTNEIAKGKNLSEIKMQDGAEIEVKDGESILLPYTYPLVQGKPLMNPRLISYLKRKKEF